MEFNELRNTFKQRILDEFSFREMAERKWFHLATLTEIFVTDHGELAASAAQSVLVDWDWILSINCMADIEEIGEALHYLGERYGL